MSVAPRLTSAILVGAVRRLAESEGGFAAIVIKGDETSGTVLLQVLEKGGFAGLFERMPTSPDASNWSKLSFDEAEAGHYMDRRQQTDPDLWLIELDVPQAPRFIATLASTT